MLQSVKENTFTIFIFCWRKWLISTLKRNLMKIDLNDAHLKFTSLFAEFSEHHEIREGRINNLKENIFENVMI